MDYTIVTIKTKDGTWEADMELPVKMKLKNVAVKVLDTLKSMGDNRFDIINCIRFTYENKLLNEEATLFDYQIWDGSIIYLDC